MKQLLYIVFLAVLLQACTKKGDTGSSTNEDLTNRLNFIIDDNAVNFSFFNTALGRTAYRKTLAQQGPYTVFVPDNNAFIKAGYNSEQAVLIESGALLNNLIAYHITTGTWELNKLPFKFNQEIESVTGARMFVTRWVKNSDTVITINGAKVLTYNLPASNGVIQVINTVLQPLVHQKLTDAIAADANLTYLNVALQRAGMKELLAGDDVYTVFAPQNAAFIAAGFASIETINQTDVDSLKKLLQYNMFKGRKFIYDYILTTGSTDATEQVMLNGNNISISLLKSGINYTGITLSGIGNKVPATIIKENVLAGNGVLHVINQLLKEKL